MFIEMSNGYSRKTVSPYWTPSESFSRMHLYKDGVEIALPVSRFLSNTRKLYAKNIAVRQPIDNVEIVLAHNALHDYDLAKT
jgi:hypothetical protein